MYLCGHVGGIPVLGHGPSFDLLCDPRQALSLSGPPHFEVKTAADHVKGFLKGL